MATCIDCVLLQLAFRSEEEEEDEGEEEPKKKPKKKKEEVLFRLGDVKLILL